MIARYYAKLMLGSVQIIGATLTDIIFSHQILLLDVCGLINYSKHGNSLLRL